MTRMKMSWDYRIKGQSISIQKRSVLKNILWCKKKMFSFCTNVKTMHIYIYIWLTDVFLMHIKIVLALDMHNGNPQLYEPKIMSKHACKLWIFNSWIGFGLENFTTFVWEFSESHPIPQSPNTMFFSLLFSPTFGVHWKKIVLWRNSFTIKSQSAFLNSLESICEFWDWCNSIIVQDEKIHMSVFYSKFNI